MPANAPASASAVISYRFTQRPEQFAWECFNPWPCPQHAWRDAGASERNAFYL